MRRCLPIAPFLLAAALSAQQNDVPLQRDFCIDLERNAARLDARIHSGLKPVIESRADLDNVQGFRVDSAKYYYWQTEKLLRDRWLIARGDGYLLTADPILTLEYGGDPGESTAYSDTNRLFFSTRGFVVRGDLGAKVSFQTMFHENQGTVPLYLYRYAIENGVLPGQGRVKFISGAKVDYGWSQGVLSYSPAAWINLQAGHGRHFVGHGCRSVLLSDNAMNAPFLKASLLSPDKRWQYTWWHTRLMHGVTQQDRLPAGASAENLFFWMRGVFHHLSIDLGRVQLGLFDASIIRSLADDGALPFDAHAINPVIGLNALLLGFEGPTNNLVGADLRIKATGSSYAYGQVATNGPGHVAWQLGARAFDVLCKGLHLQTEYAAAAPFMYMAKGRRQAYRHMGQPLAHPLGTAFGEAMAIVEYVRGRWTFRAQGSVADLLRDPSPESNLGTDLGKPDIGGPTPEEGLSFRLASLDISAQWLVNQNTNMRLIAGFRRRDLPRAPDGAQSGYWHVGLATRLFNRYYDI
ncbi:MAG: hypothetical protein ACK4L7_05415 [Flavobacteriales bacterium]